MKPTEDVSRLTTENPNRAALGPSVMLQNPASVAPGPGQEPGYTETKPGNVGVLKRIPVLLSGARVAGSQICQS